MTPIAAAPGPPAPPSGHVAELTGGFGVRSVRWYRAENLGSAAFWIDQARRSTFPASLRLGESLTEEVAVCLLGGHGITGPMTTAAFGAVQRHGLLEPGAAPTAAAIEAVLRTPIEVPGATRPIRYRFPAQRARRLSEAIRMLESAPPPSDLRPRDLRDWLTALPGVGPKTASWVTRNLTESDEIAIVDIHVQRAGIVAGVFDPGWKLPRDYGYFEQAFCAWSSVGGVRTAQLDLTIWHQLADAARRRVLQFGKTAVDASG